MINATNSVQKEFEREWSIIGGSDCWHLYHAPFGIRPQDGEFGRLSERDWEDLFWGTFPTLHEARAAILEIDNGWAEC